MTFGELAVEEAVGALSVHGVRAGGLSLRKGSVVSAEIAAALRTAGIRSIVAARLEAGDVGEDEGAVAVARAIAGPGTRLAPPFTGRANLFATEPGLLLVDRATIEAVNGVDEAVTVATLPPYRPVVTGEMLATVKIIPYGLPGRVLEAALTEAGPVPSLRVQPYRVSRVGVVSTLLPGLKLSTVTKTVAALASRLAPTGARLHAEASCPHEAAALARELAAQAAAVELIVVFGASAIADRRDVIPAAIEAAGGEVVHFGMPVDPGNLLLVGRIGDVRVIGAPGCARSPKENGFDWVLHRMLAGLDVTAVEIAGLGVGGLLMEIVQRGQPRAGEEPDRDEPDRDEA